MSAKTSFALMHLKRGSVIASFLATLSLEAIEKGRATGILFGLRTDLRFVCALCSSILN